MKIREIIYSCCKQNSELFIAYTPNDNEYYHENEYDEVRTKIELTGQPYNNILDLVTAATTKFE